MPYKNKLKKAENSRIYRLRNIDKEKKRAKEYYLNNNLKIKAKRDYHQRQPEIRAIRKKRLQDILKTWIGIIPQETNCQMCSRKILFISDFPSLSIHFDHKHEGKEFILGSPKHWLRDHPYSKENELIWKSCDFGMLCWQCNRFLPTKNRMELVNNLNRYMGVTHG